MKYDFCIFAAYALLTHIQYIIRNWEANRVVAMDLFCVLTEIESPNSVIGIHVCFMWFWGLDFECHVFNITRLSQAEVGLCWSQCSQQFRPYIFAPPHILLFWVRGRRGGGGWWINEIRAGNLDFVAMALIHGNSFYGRSSEKLFLHRFAIETRKSATSTSAYSRLDGLSLNC